MSYFLVIWLYHKFHSILFFYHLIFVTILFCVVFLFCNFSYRRNRKQRNIIHLPVNTRNKRIDNVSIHRTHLENILYRIIVHESAKKPNINYIRQRRTLIYTDDNICEDAPHANQTETRHPSTRQYNTENARAKWNQSGVKPNNTNNTNNTKQREIGFVLLREISTICDGFESLLKLVFHRTYNSVCCFQLFGHSKFTSTVWKGACASVCLCPIVFFFARGRLERFWFLTD